MTTAKTPVIEFRQVGKRFCRSPLDAFRNQSLRWLGSLIRQPPRTTLGTGEFWALRDINLAVARGECIGIIGPNGAGKSTLLRLIGGDWYPDQGQVIKRGRVISLLRLGSGLHAQLSGRENIHLHLLSRGVEAAQINRHLDAIIAMAGLEKAIDRPVKQYSDGMYSRLEFAMTTALAPDILLIDEVLSVGDLAFQARSLERIRELKQQGTTVLMVSHSEMNIRWVADRCLLLFDGEMLGCGATDELYRMYYHAVGFRQALPAADPRSAWTPTTGPDDLTIHTLRCNGSETRAVLHTDTPAEFELLCHGREPRQDVTLVLQFRDGRNEPVAHIDSGHHQPPWQLGQGTHAIRIHLPMIGLMPGVYRVTVGFRQRGHWLSHIATGLQLTVKPGSWHDDTGPLSLYARFGVNGEW